MLQRIALALAGLFGLVAVGVLGARRVSARLANGATAPEFTLQAAKGDEVHTVDLKSALAAGPVVLYFFPKSFTPGCTMEAHLFSERIGDFTQLGATVIGVSADDIPTQQRFSSQECSAAFLVASDPGLTVAKKYSAALVGSIANRTSYVIAPDGTIAYAYTNLDASKHVENTLAALRELNAPAKT